MRFRESQRIGQAWLWCLLALSAVPVYLPLFRKLFSPDTLSCKDLNLYLAIPHILITLLLLMVNLKVEISGRRLSYRFFPFHLKKKEFALNRIECAFVRKFDPIEERSLWGIHASGSVKSYHLNGPWVIQVEFKGGRILLLGTKRPEEVSKVLKDLRIPDQDMQV